MNTVNNSNKSLKFKNVSDVLNEKAKEIFKSLCNELEPGSKEIELENLRKVIMINSNNGNFKSELVELIKKYRLTDMIKEGKIKDKNYNLKINEKDFCEFVTGASLKNSLFNKNLVEKRKNVEEINTAYTLLGGDKEGISKSNLNKNISKVVKLLNDPSGYLKDDFNPDKIINSCDFETQQIINLLATSREDKLTIQDFINAMTSEYDAEFENQLLG